MTSSREERDHPGADRGREAVADVTADPGRRGGSSSEAARPARRTGPRRRAERAVLEKLVQEVVTAGPKRDAARRDESTPIWHPAMQLNRGGAV